MAIDRSIPPPVSDFSAFRLDIPDPITLSNGMKLWVIGNGEEEINKLHIYMTGGAFQESKPMQATTCSLAVFNGNKNHNYNQIAEAFDFFGSWRTAQVYDNCTCFSMSSLNENFEKILPFFTYCLRFPTFPNAEFNLIKQLLAVNCSTIRERVKYLANVEMMRLYYGANHPLATDPTPDDIESLTQEDIKSFFKANYKAQNCNVLLAGLITDREINTLDKALSSWTSTGAPTPIMRPEAKPSSEMFKIVNKEGAVQSAIIMTIKAIPRRHPDYFKLRILVTALGGYFGSRLMTNIREEKGYTYGISASLSGRDFDGYIVISTECDILFTWKVIDEVKHEMNKLIQTPLCDDELRTVKQYMLSDLAKTLDTPFNIASYIGNMFCYGTYPSYLNEHVQEIINVTSKELNDIAKQYFDITNLRIVIASDKNKLPSNDYL